MALQTRRVTTAPGQDGSTLTDEIQDLAQDSIEFSVNAKGEPSYTVKCYGKSSEEISLRIAGLRLIAEAHADQVRKAKAGGA